MAKEAQFEQLEQAQVELYNSGQYRQSASAACEMGRLASALRDNRRLAHARYWEGESLERAGDPDAALAVLIEAANMRSPDIDPADTIGAMLVAIDVAQQRKPLRYSLGLLDQTRNLLEELGKDQWGDSVTYREGRIALARGLFSSALAKHAQAWNRRIGLYPSYTIGTHLRGLCEASFLLGDTRALVRWTSTFAKQRELDVEEDRLHQHAAKVFAVRAGVDDSPGLDISRTLLNTAFRIDLRPAGAARCGLRMLFLCGAFKEAERWWDRFRERKKSLDYFDRLLVCDSQLALARADLQVPPQDDEWDTDFAVPQPPFPNREQALAHLTQAEQYYRDLSALAASEDERLETDYYTRTLNGRLERVHALRAPLG